MVQCKNLSPASVHTNMNHMAKERESRRQREREPVLADHVKNGHIQQSVA